MSNGLFNAVAPSGPVARYAPDRRLLIATFAMIAVAILIYRSTALELLRLWSSSDTYAHGWLVVPVCAWLIWRSRGELAFTAEPTWSGVLAAAAAVAVWVAGRVSDALVVQELALVALVPAFVLAACGLRCLRVLAFPCGFIVFAVPFGDPLIEPLMRITATGTVALLELSGIPVYRDGMIFDTSAGRFEVAQACSGIRYLIAFVTTGVLYAYLALRTRRYRLIFLAAAIMVPILANTFRAYFIVMLAHLSDMKLATGVDHFIYGWFFFALVLAGVLWLGERMRRSENARSPAPAAVQAPSSALAPAARRNLVVRWLATGLTCLAVAATGPFAAARLTDALAIPSRGPQGAPEGQAGWRGPLAGESTWQPRFTGNARLHRVDYLHPRYGRIALALVYYERETQADELIGTGHHLVDRNLWHFVSSRSVELDPAGNLRANRYTARGPERLTLWSTYAIAGRPLSSEFAAKVFGPLERLRNPHAAVTFIGIAYAGDADDEVADEVLRDFAHHHIEHILRCTRPSEPDGSIRTGDRPERCVAFEDMLTGILR